MQERAPIIPRHDQQFKQVFTSNCGSLWTVRKSHIGEVRSGCGMGHTKTGMRKPRDWSQRMHAWNLTMLQGPYTWRQGIMHRPWHWLIADVRGQELWTWGSARQCSSLPSHICQENQYSIEWWYRKSERGALSILHGLIKFHHYCFWKEVYVITDHKPLVGMITKDVAIISQWLQCFMLCIHLYSLYILYKPGPMLYIVYWLSCNSHVENWDQEILGMNVSIQNISNR